MHLRPPPPPLEAPYDPTHAGHSGAPCCPLEASFFGGDLRSRISGVMPELMLTHRSRGTHAPLSVSALLAQLWQKWLSSRDTAGESHCSTRASGPHNWRALSNPRLWGPNRVPAQLEGLEGASQGFCARTPSPRHATPAPRRMAARDGSRGFRPASGDQRRKGSRRQGS